MEQLARHLSFGAGQALAEGRGLLAELYALQLEGCLQAEWAADPGAASLASGGECAALLSRADASAEAAAERWAAVGGRGRVAYDRGAAVLQPGAAVGGHAQLGAAAVSAHTAAACRAIQIRRTFPTSRAGRRASTQRQRWWAAQRVSRCRRR